MKQKKLHPSDLVLRCMALRRDGYWIGMCVDLDLVVQADSARQAKKLLQEQIFSYVEEALGEDSEHAADLLTRRAPLRFIAMYYGIKWFNHARRSLSYETAMPMTPAHA